MTQTPAPIAKSNGRFRDSESMLATCLIGRVAAMTLIAGAYVLGAWTEFTHAADERTLLAGAATSNITPPLGSEVIGGFHPFPATHIHDELHARALVLDNGQARLAIVICDLLGIAKGISDEARKLVEIECEIPAANVLIAATHTHSAANALGSNRFTWDKTPLDDYQRFVVRRISDGVRRAFNQRAPAQIAWGATDKPEHVFNRRWHMKPGSIAMNPLGGQDQVKMNPPRASADLVRPAGPTDPQVSVIFVKNREGQPLALLANYSLHYVGGVGSGHISADYFGVFAEQVARKLDAEHQDPPFVAMLSNGTSGDVNNIDFRKPGEKLPPYGKIRQVADDIALAAVQATRDAKWHDWLPLAASFREVDVARRTVSSVQLERANAILAQPRDSKRPATLEEIYADRVTKFAEWPERVPVSLQVLRIGDLGIATMPCEIFTQIGLDLKRRSPLQPYFTIELAHGYYGYLPTPAQHELGGYETWLGTNRLEETASDKLSDVLVDMLSELKR
jgi:neutral/alkaline ceramidase-like enzyme